MIDEASLVPDISPEFPFGFSVQEVFGAAFTSVAGAFSASLLRIISEKDVASAEEGASPKKASIIVTQYMIYCITFQPKCK